MKDKKKIFLWICFLLFVASLAFLIGWQMRQHQSGKIYDDLQQMNKDTPTGEPEVTPTKKPELTPTDEPEVTPTVEPEEELPKVEIPIDFPALWKVNDEIHAWIRIPGTKVDYPILQRASDDTYYLNHTVEGKQGYPGSIYTESLNRKNFQDKNTVIYGHNMKNGSMFGKLHKYKDAKYMKENSKVFIYTPEHIYTYEIFAAITYDNRHLLYSFDFTEESGMQEFLDSIASVRNMSSYINKEVEVNASDRIITLSTCVGNKSKRLLVGAVLIDEQ